MYFKIYSLFNFLVINGLGIEKEGEKERMFFYIYIFEVNVL